ncbi:Fic family protein [Streptococcus pneumoniae]|uniref:Fic family protein n=1 Tax=Streptococcus pneumoniae TaxID=1313 RepID=UPI001C600A32|nr:Fic family protein [Streptococcus pneumoniae]MBW5002918.1 Fic family protein [Streptococcus pneumoniae]MBW5082205.1 Fic family protein [Streptococcus pneumoniae]MDG7118929.1 Fic family protein [Streptococcus pneumoniae]MDG7633384.1 Fic family protein [Streptococcus pneumoniae]MDG8282494.1 Fic family protein [Streptococcus pneumoniae]
MDYAQDYLDDILVRMAYHSSGIEGNTISLPETVSIILENTLPRNGKSIREFYEIENHKQAFSYLLDSLANHQALTVGLVQDFHTLLVDRLQHDRGRFKQVQNAIIGAEFQTASPAETPYLMTQWADNTAYRLDHAQNEKEILEILADTHIQIERIHPFSDGNGRTGRLILMYLAMKYLNAPIIISKDSRAHYMELLANQNVTGLADLFKKSLDYETARKGQF